MEHDTRAVNAPRDDVVRVDEEHKPCSHDGATNDNAYPCQPPVFREYGAAEVVERFHSNLFGVRYKILSSKFHDICRRALIAQLLFHEVHVGSYVLKVPFIACAKVVEP